MENVKDEDKLIKNMIELMIVKFEKHCDEYNVVLAFGGILDQMMKLEILDFSYGKIDSLTWELKLKKMRKGCTNLLQNILTKV